MPFIIQKRDKMTKDVSLATTADADPGMTVYYTAGAGTPYLTSAFAQYSSDSGSGKEPSDCSDWRDIFANGLSNWFDIKLKTGEAKERAPGSTEYEQIWSDYDRGVFHMITFQISGESFQKIIADGRWMRFDMSQILSNDSFITGVEVTPLKKTLAGYVPKLVVYPCVGECVSSSNKYIYIGFGENVQETYGFQATVHALSYK